MEAPEHFPMRESRDPGSGTNGNSIASLTQSALGARQNRTEKQLAAQVAIMNDFDR